MAAVILTTPPNDGQLWIPPGSIKRADGSTVPIYYTKGRNDGNYLNRKRRSAIHMEISHTMGGSGTETLQGFANSEMGADATLAEVATFTDGTILQSLPLNIIGAGSVDGGLTGLTHESAEESGDPNTKPWNPLHCATKAALTAWLIKNPLADSLPAWRIMNIRLQIIKTPWAPTPDKGGLGDHTMWDLCGVQAGGTNPWTLYCKSCPGYYRRGTTRKVQFPTSQITDIPWQVGNFRDYFEQVIAHPLLQAGPVPQPSLIGDPPMIVSANGDNAAFLVQGGQCSWIQNGNDLKAVAAYTKQLAADGVTVVPVRVTQQFFLNLELSGQVPQNATLTWGPGNFYQRPTGSGGGSFPTDYATKADVQAVITHVDAPWTAEVKGTKVP